MYLEASINCVSLFPSCMIAEHAVHDLHSVAGGASRAAAVQPGRVPAVAREAAEGHAAVRSAAALFEGLQLMRAACRAYE